MADFSDAADREAAWFTDDLSSISIPPLLNNGTNGAPFKVVASGLREPSKVGQYCFIDLQRVIEHRVALQRKRQIYSLVATCLWTRTQDRAHANIDQANFLAALELVVQRVRGPIGDKTHGGRFLASGEIDSNEIAIDMPDWNRALFQDGFWRADVRWQACDDFIGV